jgi:hypothetical protein
MNRTRFAWRRSLFLLALSLLPATALRCQELAAGGSAAPVPADDAAPPAEEPSAPADSGEPSSATLQPGPEGLDNLRGALPPNAYGQSPAGIPYSSVINTTGADVNSVNIVGGRPVNTSFSTSPKIGEAQGSVEGTPGSGGLLIPFLRHGAEPDDADIKAGPFFVKFHSLDGLVLYDDNYNLSETHRKSEVLMLLGVDMTVVAQLTEDLQIAVSGELAYLPLQNQLGVESNIYNSLGLLAGGPLIAAQVVYDTVISGWPVTFADDFRANTGLYSDDARDNFDLFNGDYLYRDQAGHYVFRAGNTNLRGAAGFSGGQDVGLIYFTNTVSALTDRLLPGEVRLTVRIEHQNFWYNQDTRGLPDARDDLYASLVSERPNMRFEPYISYEASEIEGYGLTQLVRAGIFGPIDDQLFMQAEVGYFNDSYGDNGLLYRFHLDHDAGPYTSEHLTIDSDLDYFDQEQRTSEYYNFDQVLGPTMVGSIFLIRSSFRELVGDGEESRSEEIGGLQLGWQVGPRTNLQLAGIAEQQNYSGGLRTDTITGRVTLNRYVSDTLTFQLLYEYQRASANEPGNSYYNNLVYFRIVKLLE